MEIKKSKAPSEDTIKKCEDILTKLLTVHQFSSIKIIVREKPRQVIFKNLPLWINGVELTTKDNEKIIINWWSSFTEDIDEKTNEFKLWTVAYSIQNAFYNKKEITPGNPNDSSDPFWKLWDYLE